MKKRTIACGVAFSLLLTGAAFAQQNTGTVNSGSTTTNGSTTGTMNTGSTTGSTGMVGRESKASFDQANKKGAATVAAIKPTSAKLSSADQALMMEVAKGGMMQLEVSRAAVQKASNEEVRQLAQAEVEEQTGLSAKLKEIATAKGITLPETPDAETQALLTKMQSASGMDFDKMYVNESGVKGHEKLDAVMTKVKSNASDSNLKAVAEAAYPLVKTHLKVAREITNKMSNGNAGGR